ncbi:MAG: sigma-54-dependent Fis family transcriptional regulator, partial [Burkholderiales bacterium]
IQERVVRPLGSPQEDTVDVRVVSATHKDLGAAVASGHFRQDLYYRLNVIEIHVPALRERREDLALLCHDLLGRICRESGLPVPDISGPVLARLQAHPFNGNVRELENMLHRAVALGENTELHLETPPAQEVVVIPDNLQDFLDGQERNILTKVLQETGFNRTAAAAKLGISLRQMRYRIARLNIVTPNGDDASDES